MYPFLLCVLNGQRKAKLRKLDHVSPSPNTSRQKRRGLEVPIYLPLTVLSSWDLSSHGWVIIIILPKRFI